MYVEMKGTVDKIEMGEGEDEIGIGRSVDWGGSASASIFADVLADFGEELEFGKLLHLFCIYLYRSSLYLVLGEERRSKFISVVCKVLGILKSTCHY